MSPKANLNPAPVHYIIHGDNVDVYKLLVETIQDYAIIMLDPEGFIRSWNAGASRLNGFRAKEILGTHFSEFYPIEDIRTGKPNEALQIAADEGRVEEEGWRLRKDGTRFWASVVITALRDKSGKLIGYGKVTRDLTQRRQVELALKRSDERIKLLLASVKDYAIFMLDPEGRVMSWNKGAETIKGYTADEIMGQHFSKFYTAEDLKRDHPAFELKEAIRLGRYEEEGLRVKKDGSTFFADVVITPLYDEQRKLRGFAKITRDITERKQAENRLKTARHQLEQKNIIASAVNDELESLCSAISHDLRTPLRGLDGYAHALGADYKEVLGDKGLHYLNRIRIAAKRMGRLIDDLLNLTRLTRAPIQVSEVNLSLLANEISQQLQKSDPLRNVQFIIAEDIMVRADPKLARALLDQLFENAWKFTSSHASAKIEFGKTADAKPAFYLRDDGAGFDMAYIDKIFGVFQRLHTQEEFEGTGVGLAIVKRIVNRHGGEIWAQAAPEKGATFYFTFGEEG